MKYSKENISFWTTDFGSLKMHKNGLTKEQVSFLKELKEGDVLIIFNNTEKKSDVSPDYSMKKILREENK